MKFTVSVVAAALFAGVSTRTSTLLVQAKEATKLTVLHLNDHHSHLTEKSAGSLNIKGDDIPATVKANNDNTSYLRAYYGGYPRVATAFAELKAEAETAGRDVLKLHAGDAITGTTYFTLFEGVADAKLMTHVCYDAFVPGNHEFDKGDAGLAKFLRAMRDEHASSTCDEMPAILAANIVPHAESALLETDVPQFEHSKVFPLPNGELVGIVGIDTKHKTMNSSQPDPGTIVLDEKETAEKEVKELQDAGVNKIILLTHIGYQNDINWMGSLDGVDVVVGGDSHSLLGDENTAMFGDTKGSYATVIDKPDGSKVCIVQSWSYSRVIGNLHIDFDEDGKVESCEGIPVFPFNPDRVTNKGADTAYDLDEADSNAVLESLIERSGGQVQLFAENEAAVADLSLYAKEVDRLSQAVLATLPEAIPLEQNGYESGACDVVVEGLLLSPLSTADMALQNRGGCRESFDEGTFTIEDAYTLLPFSNTMINIQMTGQQIKNVLEDAMDYYIDPAGSYGAYPRSSGLRFDINEAMDKGSRVNNIEVNSRLEGEWVEMDMSETYSLTTISFLAGGKDGYREFVNIDKSLMVDTFVEYAQSFIEYAEKAGTLTKVSPDRASTQTWTAGEDDSSATSSAALRFERTTLIMCAVGLFASVQMLSMFL